MSDKEYIISEKTMNMVFNTLRDCSNVETYRGERTGGVLQGCPRGEAPSGEFLAASAKPAFTRLEKEIRSQQALAQSEGEQDRGDRACVEDDGCPTEMAVLKRFWREQQSEGEPVAWMNSETGRLTMHQGLPEKHCWGNITPLYTHLSNVRRLSDDEMDYLAGRWAITSGNPTVLIRMAMDKCGLKGGE